MSETTVEETWRLHKRLVYFVRGQNYGSISKLNPMLFQNWSFCFFHPRGKGQFVYSHKKEVWNSNRNVQGRELERIIYKKKIPCHFSVGRLSQEFNHIGNVNNPTPTPTPSIATTTPPPSRSLFSLGPHFVKKKKIYIRRGIGFPFS